MISQEEGEFYSKLRGDIAQHPDWVLSAMQAIQSGLKLRIDREINERIEWETIAINAMEARLFKSNKGWLAQKIEKLENTAFFRWSHIIERLQK